MQTFSGTWIIGPEARIRSFGPLRVVALPGLAAAILMSAALSHADARLLNMDGKTIVPGEYYVSFKNEEALERTPEAELSKATILPDLLPRTRTETEELAAGLAESVRAVVSKVIVSRWRRAFMLQRVTDEGLRELAKDPRIDFIEPVKKISLD